MNCFNALKLVFYPRKGTEIMKKMRYTEALRKLFEVMEGRPDIKEIKFDRENDSFNVISDTGIHVCFGNEFRKSNKDEIKICKNTM